MLEHGCAIYYSQACKDWVETPERRGGTTQPTRMAASQGLPKAGALKGIPIPQSGQHQNQTSLG